MKIVDEDLFQRARINTGKLGVALLIAALASGYFAFVHYSGDVYSTGLRLTLRITAGCLFYAGLKAIFIKRSIDASLGASEPTEKV
jgi:hypothetical protein